jgi:hypothetical protein
MARNKTEDEKSHSHLLGCMREVLRSEQGKDVIWNILGMCQLYSESFTGNSTTFYNEGKRAVGLEILQLLEDVNPAAYADLLIHQQRKEK